MRERYLLAVDLGNTQVRAALGVLSKHGLVKVEGLGIADTKGFVKGKVTDLDTLSGSIAGASESACKQAGVRAYNVVCGIPADTISCDTYTGVRLLSSRKPRTVTAADVRALIKDTEFLSLNAERTVLHSLPYDFTLDGQSGVCNPLGLYGNKLGVRVTIIHALAVNLQNIAKSVDYAGLSVKETVFSGYADFLGSSDRRYQGDRIVVDIGSDMTVISLAVQGVLRGIGVSTFGGRQIDQAIAERFGVPLREATRLKERFVDLSRNEDGEDHVIECERISGAGPVSVFDLCRTVREVLTERLTAVWGDIRTFCGGNLAGGEVILVGGGALIKGIDAIVSRLIGPATIGLPRGVIAERLQISDPRFVALAGLLKYGLLPAEHDQFGKRTEGTVITKVKDFLEEYF